MSRRRSPSDSFSPGEQIQAFQETAAEIRKHPLFLLPEYTFSFHLRSVSAQQWEMAVPAGNRDQQHQFASMIRPLISNDDMIALPKIFRMFGSVCTDALLRKAMSDLRDDYVHRQKGMLFSRTTQWREGEPPGRWVSDREIAKAVLYGSLLHRNPRERRLLSELGSLTEMNGDQHAAVMRLFHEAGSTALRVDEVLTLAAEQNALNLRGRRWYTTSGVGDAPAS